MKNNNCNHNCGNPLCNTCGTVLNLSNTDFRPSQDHLVYMDKVYSKSTGTACPIVFDLTTTPETYQTQLFLSPLHDNASYNLCEEIFGCCDCGKGNDMNICNQLKANEGYQGCNCYAECVVDESSVFNVLNSYVNVLSFQQTVPCDLAASQVTLNGIAVDSIECQGGLFEATLSQNLANILNRTCTENNLPTKAFFLISDAGPWSYFAEFIIEGTVTTSGKTCCFRAIFTPTVGAEPTPIPTTTSNLAIPKLSIPCSSGNALPRIDFYFGGKMSLLNPEITVTGPAGNVGGVLLSLTSTGVAEPTISVEVIKRTLFCLNAVEADIPCDGTHEDTCCNCCNCGNSSNSDICQHEKDDQHGCCGNNAIDSHTFKEDYSDNCICEKIAENIQSSYCGNTIFL